MNPPSGNLPAADPVLLPIPERLRTKRLLLRCPQSGDGSAVYEAISETFDQLCPWFGRWAQTMPTPEWCELEVRKDAAQFMLRTGLEYNAYRLDSNELVGRGGLHKIDWEAKKFMMVWWVRTCYQRMGYGLEAAIALIQLAMEDLHANRLELWIDARNHRSKALAVKLGFVLEGTIRNYDIDNSGQLRDRLMYSIIPADYNEDVNVRCRQQLSVLQE